MTRIHTLLGTCVTVLVTSAIPALAQGPTITSPTPNQVFRAGPDFATDVLHDPWDFSNVEDVTPHPDDYLNWEESQNARSIGPSAFGLTGKFIARSSSNDPMLGLLYQGTGHTVVPGRSGLRYPIDAAQYGKLAFKMKVSGAAGSVPTAYWFLTKKPVTAGSVGYASASPTSIGERVYQIDLAAGAAGAPYQGQILGLRLDPVSDPNAAIEVDWVRLTAADGPAAAMMPVGTSGCGAPRNVDVFDGTVTTRVLTNTSTNASFNYGVFPPGSYQLLVSCNGVALSPVPFTINNPPRVTVVAPSERGSVDYATTVLNNPWDFADAADVPSWANVSFLGASPGQLHAVSTGTTPSQLQDSQLFFLNREGAARPIATSRFRYATFSLGLNAPFALTNDGSVARLVWASTPGGFDGTVASVSGDILLWPGLQTYTIDLAQLTPADGTLAPCPTCSTWGARSARYFRLDPHEFSSRPLDFYLGTVTLTAPAEVTQGGTFPIQWQASEAAPGSVANIYLDLDAIPGGEAPIGSASASAGVLNWQASVPPGDYYVFVQIVEPVASTPPANDIRGAYSTGVLRVLPATPPGVVSIATPASGSTAYSPFNISGCAYNGVGGADDEVLVYAHPLQGQMGGNVQLLGHNAAGGLGTIAPTTCAGGLPGYEVSNLIGLAPGLWHFRVLGRNTLTGDFDEVQAQNVSIGLTSGAPGNFRASISGNTVSLAWDRPVGGEVTQYRIEAANNPGFAGFSWAVLPPSQTSITATIGDGTYYLRVRAGNTYSNDGPPSNVLNFTLPGGGPVAAPGAIALSGQVNANPVSLYWSQAGGGAATYALHAGSTPGASNIAIVPMGTATSLPPVVVPPGVSIFARIVASNAAGSTVSNEVVVSVPAPGPPGGPPIQLDPIVDGNTVTIRWNPPAGGATPTNYAIVGRVAGSPAVIAVVPGLTSTSFSAPGVPSGNFVTTIVAMYGSTPSIESNPKNLVVP